MTTQPTNDRFIDSISLGWFTAIIWFIGIAMSIAFWSWIWGTLL